VTEAQFEKAARGIRAENLKAFLWIRLHESLDTSVAPKLIRGSYKQLAESPNDKFLFQECYKVRSNPIIAQAPSEPVAIEPREPKFMQPYYVNVQNVTNFQDSGSLM